MTAAAAIASPSSTGAPPPPPPSESAASTGASSNVSNANALAARELEWANNTPELLEEHAKINGSLIRTRFPPEPNGFLHIGHAKSMNMNFRLAFEKLGVPMEDRRTIFRYDDTNPEAETEEYVTSLRRDLEWLGWKPECTTYSSDNFQKLYDLAVILVKKGLAYACDFDKAKVEAQRDLAKRRAGARARGEDPDVVAPLDPALLPGPNRDTSVERNMEILENMRMGVYDEGEWTLRLKMDFDSPNPNMYDLMAYRIKYVPHPHSGDEWCIYPMYDWTHGICDSLEHIDYSICTLEFETRREPYYWILWALDLYRPKVYEMSRLNLQYTVLSKRRLLKLVDAHHVRGWNDPRMPTVSGLRRRGYTADIINSFCEDVGATRAANVVEMEKLNHTARTKLSVGSRRAMAALDPIEVEILNFDDAAAAEESMEFVVQNSPTDESYGSHTVTLTPVIYIDASDFRLMDEKNYYGLAPQKAVGLKYYGGNLFCEEVLFEDGGKTIKKLKCTVDNTEGRTKPKTFITWVPSNGIRCEIRVYNNLFTVPEPTDAWEDEINPESEVVYMNSIVDPSVLKLCDASNVNEWHSNNAFQFERFGYFCVDIDTTFDSSQKTGDLVFNRTVNLREEQSIKKMSSEEEEKLRLRHEKQRREAELKEARANMDPKEFFMLDVEYAGKYGGYNEDGIPTHLANGEALTKSAMKKLAKVRAKLLKK